MGAALYDMGAALYDMGAALYKGNIPFGVCTLLVYNTNSPLRERTKTPHLPPLV